MKIVQAVHLFHPATGGIETHVLNLSREFVKNGNEVIVLTTKFRDAPSEEELNGIKIKRFWSISAPFASSVNFSPGLIFELIKQNADVYCSHGYGSLVPFFTGIIAFVKGKKFVFTLHGYPKLSGILGVMQFFYKTFIASVYLRIAKRVIIVSEKSREIITNEVGADKIFYIPNGVIPNTESIKSFEEASAISYIGRLDEYKGIDVLIRAFSKISGVKLNIVGKDEGMKTELEKIGASVGVKANFYELPQSKIRTAYEESKAIILPSRYEGFSMVWLESINYERPVFSTQVGDAEILFNEIYGKNAGLFIFKDEGELVEKLSYFLKNQNKFAAIVSAAKKKMILRYTWEKIAAETIKVYLTE